METKVYNETLNLRETFFDKAQESLAIFDKELNFIDVNEALLNSLHLTKEQIIGKNIGEISPGIEETERYKLYLDVIKTGEQVVLDEVRTHPSLGNFVSRISIFKVGDGMGLAAQNITDLTEAVNELETFVYKSSHDMRSPIASILGLISLADTEITDIDTSKHYLTIIKQQVERLDNILRKLVDTTRIQHGDKVIHLIDFNQLINDILKALAFMKGFNEIHIEHNILSKKKFYSDKPLLVSLFQNLMDNAIKYKRENINNSFLKITITDESDGIKIVFTDNGIGIPTHLQKDIFNMFFRATDKASGSGLGLYTVKHCIKKLGGHISQESEENIGTTFTVYLPNEKPPHRSE
jgi:PAS domain S-box-containing protein